MSEEKTVTATKVGDSAAKSSSGIDPTLAAILAWIFSPISSLILIVVEKDNKFIKFHAWQSLAVGIIGTVIQVVSIPLAFVGIGLCTSPVGGLLWVVMIIIGVIKAAQGEMYKFPGIGDWAEKQAEKKGF